MRRSVLPITIIIIITALGIFFSFTYKIPEIQVFQNFQNLDQEIVTCEKQNTNTLEENLNVLQLAVNQLIIAGQTYDGTADLSDTFKTFNEQYNMLKNYTESVSPCMSSVIEKTDFEKINKVLTKLPEQLMTIGTDMTDLQQERTTKLTNLTLQLDSLVETLSNFEDMFYNTKTSEAVQYFQNVNVAFEEVQTSHTDYIKTVEAYYAAKTNYYENIANKGVFEYIFEK